MAKVQIDGDFVDIQVSWLDRVELGERPRRVPLRHIKAAWPRNLPTYGHGDRGVWTHDLGRSQSEAASASAPVYAHWVALELCGEAEEHLWIDVEQESPELVAARIEQALRLAEGRSAPLVQHKSGVRRRPLPAPVVAMKEDDSKHLTQLGRGLILLGMVCIAGGSLMLLLGIVSGLLGLGAGLICGMLGACAWAVGVPPV